MSMVSSSQSAQTALKLRKSLGLEHFTTVVCFEMKMKCRYCPQETENIVELRRHFRQVHPIHAGVIQRGLEEEFHDYTWRLEKIADEGMKGIYGGSGQAQRYEKKYLN